MAEQHLRQAVGAPPATNASADVRIVQTLLRTVRPPLFAPLAVTGRADANTLNAIREYQRRFMSRPDGRIDPNGRTLMRLNWEPTARQDVQTAQQWLNRVNQRLAQTGDADAQRKVRNIFHIDLYNPADAPRVQTLRGRYQTLRRSLDQSIPFRFNPRNTGMFDAEVDLNDPTGTITFYRRYFNLSPIERAGKITHERAHTVFRIGHEGMVPTGEVHFAHRPDDPNTYTTTQAMGNAYCYEWLATALQPNYRPPAGEAPIVVPRPPAIPAPRPHH